MLWEKIGDFHLSPWKTSKTLWPTKIPSKWSACVNYTVEKLVCIIIKIIIIKNNYSSRSAKIYCIFLPGTWMLPTPPPVSEQIANLSYESWYRKSRGISSYSLENKTKQKSELRMPNRIQIGLVPVLQALNSAMRRRGRVDTEHDFLCSQLSDQ